MVDKSQYITAGDYDPTWFEEADAEAKATPTPTPTPAAEPTVEAEPMGMPESQANMLGGLKSDDSLRARLKPREEPVGIAAKAGISEDIFAQLKPREEIPEPAPESGFMTEAEKRIEEKWGRRKASIGELGAEADVLEEQFRRGELTQEEVNKALLQKGAAGTLKVIGNVVGGAIDVPVSIAAEAIDRIVPEGVKESASEWISGGGLFDLTPFSFLFSKEEKQKTWDTGMKALAGGMKIYGDWAEEHEDAASAIEGAIGILEGLGAIKAVGAGIKQVGVLTKKLAERRLAKKVITPIGIKEITKAVSPKMTPKAAREAYIGARIEVEPRGRIMEFLFGEKAGRVIPSARAERGIGVIARDLPDVDLRNKPKLFEQIQDLGLKKRKELQPVLQKMKVSAADRKELIKIAKDYETDILDNKAIADLLSVKEKRSLRKVLDDLKNAKNADDIWEARIRFDAFTPESIKNPVGSPSGDILLRHKVWKDTRNPLNDQLEIIAERRGIKGPKEDFLDMSSLFELRQDMITRAPELLKGTTGVINIRNAARTGLGLMGVKYIF